jgi:hypothetical protein
MKIRQAITQKLRTSVAFQPFEKKEPLNWLTTTPTKRKTIAGISILGKNLAQKNLERFQTKKTHGTNPNTTNLKLQTQ